MTVTTPTAAAGRARGTRRVVLRWLVTFVGFPLGGLAAMLLVGPVDSATAAVLGGLLTGVILGSAQALALGLDGHGGTAWAVATGVGLGAGLALGAGLVDFGATLGDLVLQGAVTGAAVGLLQGGLLVRDGMPIGFVWPVYLAAVWGVGWTVTTLIGVQVEDQFTVFGSAGALTVTLLTAVLPAQLARRSSPTR